MPWLLLIGVLFIVMKEKKWTIPTEGKPYAQHFADAESQHGLPFNLLARVAYQESRFRQDIITGEKISGAGAVGIMQIVPRWHPNVDPLNTVEAIFYAASYLSKLHTQFGSWDLALAAYNWGPGNLRKHGIDDAPLETRNYIAQIGRDVTLT